MVKWTDERDKKLIKLYREGKNNMQIEIALRCSINTWKKRLRELGEIK